MIFKKIIAIIFAIIFIACITSIPVIATAGFQFGNFTLTDGNNQQVGWCTNGVDGIETNLDMYILRGAADLVFHFDVDVDNFILVCLGDGNGWTWTETPVIPIGNWISIDTKNINGWADVMKGDNAKILLCNYNPNWDGINFLWADLISPGGSGKTEIPLWISEKYETETDKKIIPAFDFEFDYVNINEIYEIEIEKDGKYYISAWLASLSVDPGYMEIYVDDKIIGKSGKSLNTGWDDYNLYPVGEIDLAAGTHIIKLKLPQGSLNYCAVEIASADKFEPEPEINNLSPKTGNISIIYLTAFLITASIVLSKKRLRR